jgi:chemotaxis protein MotB
MEVSAMPKFATALWLPVLALGLLAGCADNAMVLKGRMGTLEKQQRDLAGQNQELQNRLKGLDAINQDTTAQLAQAQERTKVAEERVGALNEQLRSLNSQLAQTKSEKQTADDKARAMTASLQRQSGVSITPNNSYLQTLPVIHLPDVQVRRHGDVIRVELPGHRLFDSSGARLQPSGTNLVAEVANELRRTYPDQTIGIEGHTNSDPVLGGQFHNNHELSLARATAVYEVLVAGGRFRADQVFIVGHGANHPVVSNATAEGKQRNRRVELVVYPEKRGQ